MATSNRQQTPDIMAAVLGSERQTGLQRLPLAAVRRDGGTQPRAGVSEAHVDDLVADLREGAVLPPVDVTYDGTDYWLWDGFHRVEAWRRAGRADVDARVHQGSQADAQWASYAANKAHGLRRTNADKTRAVQAALKHPNGAARSNREIGRYLGVDEKTVRYWRETLEAGAEIPQVTQRTGADGKTYDTTGIGAAQQARAASFGEYVQAVRNATAAGAVGDGLQAQRQLRWLTLATTDGLMATAPGDDRAAVEKARRLVLADLIQVVKAEQAAADAAAATAGPRQATANECYAAVWKAVKAATLALGAAERLQVVVALQVAEIRAQLPRGLVADDVALAGARSAVERELRNQADHEARKDARRATLGGGSTGSPGGGSSAAGALLTPTYAQVEQAFAAWQAFVQPTPAELQELRRRWTDGPLWHQMLAAVMSHCKTAVGIKTEWLQQVIDAALAASVAQPGPAKQIEPAEPTTGEERTAKLHRLKLLFMQCTDALTLWSQMTGREVITLEARRGLRAVIDATSALIDGKAGMDGKSEEVQ